MKNWKTQWARLFANAVAPGVVGWRGVSPFYEEEKWNTGAGVRKAGQPPASAAGIDVRLQRHVCVKELRAEERE